MEKLKVKTPVGEFLLEESFGYITKCYFLENKIKIKNSNSKILLKAEKQLNEFFSGKRKKFDLPLKPEGTEFQKSVWNKLIEIPYGETLFYQELACKIKNPKAMRAVGSANGKNPIAIIIPCHRVIRKSGELGGYSAGGNKVKKWLLSLENAEN